MIPAIIAFGLGLLLGFVIVAGTFVVLALAEEFATEETPDA